MGRNVDSQQAEQAYRESPSGFLDLYLREWAGKILPYTTALGIKPRGAVFAAGYGEIAAGDIEGGLTKFWLGLLSGMVGRVVK